MLILIFRDRGLRGSTTQRLTENMKIEGTIPNVANESFYLSALITRRNLTMSSTPQHAMARKLGGSWGVTH